MKRHNELEAEPTDSQHDENVTTTRGRRKPVHNTPSTDSQDVQAPAAAPKLIPVPVYKTGNKRKQIKKGDVSIILGLCWYCVNNMFRSTTPKLRLS